MTTNDSNRSVCLCLSVYLCFCLSACLSVCLSLSLSVCLSLSLSVSRSVCLSICLSVCLSVSLSVSLLLQYTVIREDWYFSSIWNYSIGKSKASKINWLTEQTADWRTEQPSQSQSLRPGSSRARDHYLSCGPRAKDMTPTIAWTEEREAWTDASVGDLPSKDEGWLSTVVRRDTGGHANNPPSTEQAVKTQPKAPNKL